MQSAYAYHQAEQNNFDRPIHKKNTLPYFLTLRKKTGYNLISSILYSAVDYSIHIYVQGTLCNLKTIKFKKKTKNEYSEFNLFF